MKKKKPILSVVAIVSLLVMELSPLASAMAVNQPKVGLDQPKVDVVKDIEVKENIPTDWSEVNWNDSIVLPRDLEDYDKQVAELVDNGKVDEVKNLKVKNRKMSDKEVMEYYKVPGEIQDYVKDNSSSKDKKTSSKILKTKIKSWMVSNKLIDFSNDKNEKENLEMKNIIDLNKVEKLDLNHLKASKSSTDLKPTVKIQKRTVKTKNHKLFDVTLEGIKQKELKKEPVVEKVSFSNKLKKGGSKLWGAITGLFKVETVMADDPTPIIEYYEGIENNPMDFTLYYLSKKL